MSVNVQRYKADSNKLVGMLIPFFIRGGKVLQFMSAICSPMNDVNESFTSWTKEKIAETVATSQPVVLKWLLDEKLQGYFQDSDSHFQIMFRNNSEMFIYEDQEEYSQYQDVQDIYALENIEDSALSGTDNKIQLTSYDLGELESDYDSFTVVAPTHSSLIGEKEYKRQITYWVNKYLVYNIKFNIVIN